MTGTRALEIAGRLGDLRLHIPTTTYLEHAHYWRGEYERVVELATDNLTALPAGWIYEFLGNAAPPSVYDRAWLVMSLAQLGRFAEAAKHEAEAIRLAEPTQHAFTIGLAYRAAVNLHLLRVEAAQGIEEALGLASRCGIPAQNFVAADSMGRITYANEAVARLAGLSDERMRGRHFSSLIGEGLWTRYDDENDWGPCIDRGEALEAARQAWLDVHPIEA